ncbi:undecaprenyl-phosphate glucose phosphotransferase [Polaribacter sp. Asnod1-A03]|uniref:undecaprenyl-phosphate glucose phosphotransferase n=1 Tax=Polaribacter sp. Asnod1-A03 TaxID=3160581 RepID=UPI00386323AB
MFKPKNKKISLMLLLVDITLLLSCFVVAKLSMFNLLISLKLEFVLLFLSWSLLWAIIGLKQGLYDVPRIIQMHKVVAKNLKAFLIFFFISTGLFFIVTEYEFSRKFVLLVLLFFVMSMTAFRMFVMYWLKHTRKKGNRNNSIVIIGMNENVTKLIEKIYKNKSYGFQIKGVLTDAKVTPDFKEFYKGKLADVTEFLDQQKLDEIIISLPYTQSKLINDLFRYADNNMIRVRIIPEFSEYLSQVFTIDYVHNIPVMKLRNEPLNKLSNRVIKRVFDIVFSLGVILLIFSWLFPIIAIIIKLTSKGPVFFKQLRTGKDDEPFSCLKFRSMVVNTESDAKQATKGDKRVTPFGAFMRRTSIDELPQILNVLFNNMSLVGPRPHMLKHTEEYRGLVDKFMVRHFAKPGVTGWAQINGYRGETKEVSDMANRAEADIWYLENWSFMLDIKIIFNTAFSMFFKKDENAF